MHNSANASGSSAHAEWDAYVREVRDSAANREVEFIGRYTELTPAGDGSFKGSSPFRSEKTPSFFVWLGRGCWDFGSQQGGDLIAFVRLRDPSLTFRLAVDFVARELGLDDWDARKAKRGASAPDPETLEQHIDEMSHAERIFAAMTWLAHHCHTVTPSSVREHMIGRGYSGAFIDQQKIGWCPDSLWELVHADARPFTDEELLATGWFFPQGDAAFATFGGRIVFPYWKNGQCRYAIGREHFGRATRADIAPEWFAAHSWDSGKYKKLPVHSEKRPWISACVRNDVLWGEDTLRLLRANGVLCIAEGVTDAGILAMLGFPVVSPVTVNFRNDDVDRVLTLLAHYRVKRVVILNDNDTTPDGKHPGLDGAKRMAAGLWKGGQLVSIARLPRPAGATKMDINELVASAIAEGGEDHARAVVQKIIDGAELYPLFLASETSVDAQAPALQPLLEELGTLAASPRLAELERVDLLQKIVERFHRLPRRELRKVLNSALASAQNIAPMAAGDAAAPPEGEGAAAGGAPSKTKKKSPEMRGHIFAHPNGYYERESPVGARECISNFRLVAIRRIAHERGGPEWHCVRVVAPDDRWDGADGEIRTLVEEWAISPKAWITTNSFFASFPSSRMVWSGSDIDTRGALEQLTLAYNKVPLVRATGTMGRHTMPDGTLRFVVPAGTIGPDGQWMTEPDLLYLPDGGSNLQHRLPKDKADLASPETRALAKEFFEQVLLLHDPRHMAAIASWSMASLFAPFIRTRTGSFPILHVFATPGSGKTSLFQSIIWPAFVGVQRGELLACTSSDFAYARDFASANALPLFLDEFKQDIGPKAIERILRSVRRIYAGDTETRGRADQDVNVYFLAIPLGVFGEMRMEGDQAVHERCIFVGLSANYLKAHPDAKERFYALAAKLLASIAPLIQAWSLTADAPGMYARAQTLLAETLAQIKRSDLPERVKHNATCLLFGAVALDACAASFGTAVADVSLPAFIDKVIGEIFNEIDGDRTTSGGTRVRDYLDEFYCLGATMAVLGIISDGKEYVWVDGRLRLYVPGIVAAMETWFRGRGQVSTIPHGAVLRIARERLASGEDTYVTAVGQQTQLSEDHRARCIEIAPEKVPSWLGADSYPKANEKGWGGKRYGGVDWAATAAAAAENKKKD